MSADHFAVHSYRTPGAWFTPTHLYLASEGTSPPSASWQSRRARKGRYAPKNVWLHNYGRAGWDGQSRAGLEGKIKASEVEARQVAARFHHSKSHFEPHLRLDISFWIAFVFTLGSAVWVVNGFLVWFPILRPELDTDAFSETAAAMAFIGGTIFLVGSYMMVVEALDRGREIHFETAMGNLLHLHRGASQNRTASNEKQTDKTGASPNGSAGSAEGRIWWGPPMWHDMGYLAAIVQLFAATIFWVSTVTGLPGVIPGFSEGEGSLAIIDVFFWTPQVIGGNGFIVSSLILMAEVQKKWYKPNLTDIGWHVGFWNLIGALGFMLCGALGYSSGSGEVYQSALSTWWGSWAFLIGSVIQLGEAVWREPDEQ